MKKIYISADIEGITGVTNWNQTGYGKEGYENARRQMALEVGAACKAAIDAGYKVVVKDSHDTAFNIDHELLPRGVELIKGWLQTPLSMVGGLDETFDGVIFIGYHSAAGTVDNPLSHTMDSGKYHTIKINGKLTSEFELHSLMAAELGVKSLFISGDQGICDEARASVPTIGTYATKKGIGRGTWNKHPLDSIDEIERLVKEALNREHELRPLEENYELELKYRHQGDARNSSWYPGAKLVDDFTVVVECSSPFEIGRVLNFI